MPRTPEQKTADEALAEAVQRCRNAYVEDGQGVITEFLVIYASRFWDDEGESMTAIGKLLCEPPPPLHHQLGMLDYVATQYRHSIVTDD